MLNHVDTVHECDRQTDGRTDRITITKTVQRIASRTVMRRHLPLCLNGIAAYGVRGEAVVSPSLLGLWALPINFFLILDLKLANLDANWVLFVYKNCKND